MVLCYNDIMNEKIIKPLNNNIKIEENKSFASKDIQKKASDAYSENIQKEALAIETRSILKQRSKYNIQQEIAKMRKNILWLTLFFVIMFIIYYSQKSNLSLMWIIFIILQAPYYIFKRSKIIKKHKDDFKI